MPTPVELHSQKLFAFTAGIILWHLQKGEGRRSGTFRLSYVSLNLLSLHDLYFMLTTQLRRKFQWFFVEKFHAWKLIAIKISSHLHKRAWRKSACGNNWITSTSFRHHYKCNSLRIFFGVGACKQCHKLSSPKKKRERRKPLKEVNNLFQLFSSTFSLCLIASLEDSIEVDFESGCWQRNFQVAFLFCGNI